MVEQKLEIFRGGVLSEEEAKILDETSHSALLHGAFTALADELDQNGNTEKFDSLRIGHAVKLMDYWRTKVTVYKQAVAEGRILDGQELIRGNERLTVSQLGVYENDEEMVLNITRRTKTEDDEVSITASLDSGIDEFMHPPMIKSKVSTDPDEPSINLYYELILRSNAFYPDSPFKISTFQRTLVREDPNHVRHYIKDTRIIDSSSFGVEGSFEK